MSILPLQLPLQFLISLVTSNVNSGDEFAPLASLFSPLAPDPEELLNEDTFLMSAPLLTRIGEKM